MHWRENSYTQLDYTCVNQVTFMLQKSIVLNSLPLAAHKLLILYSVYILTFLLVGWSLLMMAVAYWFAFYCHEVCYHCIEQWSTK